MSFNNGGFIEEDAPRSRPVDEDGEPAAMESEYYVDGKIKVGAKHKNGKKKGKKSKKKEETNYFSYCCGLLRGITLF